MGIQNCGAKHLWCSQGRPVWFIEEERSSGAEFQTPDLPSVRQQWFSYRVVSL